MAHKHEQGIVMKQLPLLAPTFPGQSLADAIYATLRDAIIRGDLQAGYRLREIPLSQHFGVSTTPVRSALHRLDFEGLVEISPRRGAVVASVDGHELRELYELREILECHALRNAAETGNHDLSSIKAILAESENAAGAGDHARFNELDLEFHSRLTELGGNDELLTIAQQTHRRIQAVRVRYAVALPDQPRISHREHLAIVRALDMGDAAAAVEELRRHILAVRDTVLDVLTTSNMPGSAGPTEAGGQPKD